MKTHLEINTKNQDAYLRNNEGKAVGYFNFDTYEVQHGEQNKAEFVFICCKCDHRLYVELNGSVSKLNEIANKDCPSCGEEGYENWLLGCIGNYDREQGGS